MLKSLHGTKKVYKKCTKSVCSRSVLPPLPPEPLWVGDHLAQAPAGHPLPADRLGKCLDPGIQDLFFATP